MLLKMSSTTDCLMCASNWKTALVHAHTALHVCGLCKVGAVHQEWGMCELAHPKNFETASARWHAMLNVILCPGAYMYKSCFDSE